MSTMISKSKPSVKGPYFTMSRCLYIGVALSLLVVTPATFAADSTRAWGASSNVSTQMQSSSSFHVVAGQSAQIVSSEGDTRPVYKSVTTCGVCTYNTNTGNNNTIDGNSITSTNTGSVSASTNFSDTTLVTTNGPTTAQLQ